jgi:hypothetical protein
VGNEPGARRVAGAHPCCGPDPIRVPHGLIPGRILTKSGDIPSRSARGVSLFRIQRRRTQNDGGLGTTGVSWSNGRLARRSGFRSRVWACGRLGVTRVSTQRSLPARPKNVRNCGRDPASGSLARVARAAPVSFDKRVPRDGTEKHRFRDTGTVTLEQRASTNRSTIRRHGLRGGWVGGRGLKFAGRGASPRDVDPLGDSCIRSPRPRAERSARAVRRDLRSSRRRAGVA